MRLPRALRALADFLFPPVCLTCDKDTEGPVLCSECLAKIQPIEQRFCQRCGAPLDRNRRSGVCRECVKHPLSLSRIRAWARFTYPLDKLVYAFKYNQQLGLRGFFSTRLSLVLSSDPVLASADLIVPVPLHPFKKWRRGYNQSAVLAKTLSRDSGIPFAESLSRVRITRTQTNLPAADRRDNVQGAFSLNPKNIPQILDRRILLLDDVITTGSTLDEASKVLLDAGAKDVMGLTIGGAWVPRE